MSLEPYQPKPSKKTLFTKDNQDSSSNGGFSLALLSAAGLVCGVMAAKTLAVVVDGLDPPSVIVALKQTTHRENAPPTHTRALSDRFLRKGLDDIATGSIDHKRGN
ncbi:MAG: hypothetical protein ACKOPH_07775 [Methylocystis sp.]